MKKFTAMLLVLALALSLCACGGSKEPPLDPKYEPLINALENHEYEAAYWEVEALYRQAIENGDIPAPSNPQQEDWELMNRYENCARWLKNYVENGSLSIWISETDTNYEGSAALAYVYEELQNLGDVDRWLAEESVDFGFDGMVRDRQKLLDGFAIVPDQALKVTYKSVDNMGNENNGTYRLYIYDANGVLTREYLNSASLNLINYQHAGWLHYTYDANGRIESYKIADEGSNRVDAVITPTYDDAGNKVSETMKDNSGEYLYTYTNDAEGRVTLVEWSTKYDKYKIEYTYDADGNLDKAVKMSGSEQSDGTIRWANEYIYDYEYAGGVPTGMTYTYNYHSTKWDSDTRANVPYIYSTKTDTYVYTCDAQGRILTEEVTYGQTEYANGDAPKAPDVANRTINHEYGDYYFYAPVA